MENFIYEPKTKILFGKGQISHLPSLIAPLGQKVLLVYGGGSIKKSGLYQTILELLSPFNVVEFGGVMANPTLELARSGVSLAKREGVEVVVAVGGGSVLDVAKAIAAGAVTDSDLWEYYEGRQKVSSRLGLIGVVTLAAAGSETSMFAVLTNTATGVKKGLAHPLLRYDAVIADPTYTATTPPLATSAGVADIMSHVFEGYFRLDDAFMQNRMAEAIIATCLKYGPVVNENPDDYQGRAQLLWAAGNALNNFLSCGKLPFTSPCHMIEHPLSAHYNVSHGVGLAIITPVYLRYALSQTTLPRYVELAQNVFKIKAEGMMAAEMMLEQLEAFYKSIGLPSRLSEVGIPKADLKMLAQQIYRDGRSANWFRPADEAAILTLLETMY